MALTEILTTARVRAWAGSRSYQRGEDYFLDRRVSDLKTVKGTITATVSGTYPYRVMLWDEGTTKGDRFIWVVYLGRFQLLEHEKRPNKSVPFSRVPF